VRVSAGEFDMGVGDEEERAENLADRDRGMSRPVRRIRVARDFWIARYEVTVAEFRAFATANRFYVPEVCTAQTDTGLKLSQGRSWRDPGFRQSDHDPVVCVSWNDARAYTAWLSAQTGHTYRLPSEAEWEMAARAGTRTPWFWGGVKADACRFANVLEAQHAAGFDCKDGTAYTARVGSCWSNDLWGIDAATGKARVPDNCQERVRRGGAFSTFSAHVRSGFREIANANTRAAYIGFRVVREED
jgi:formylglycine-generating enzyme required for sulfatase activity